MCFVFGPCTLTGSKTKHTKHLAQVDGNPGNSLHLPPDAPAAASFAAAKVPNAAVSEQAAPLDRRRRRNGRGEHGGRRRQRQLLWRRLSHLPTSPRRRTIYGWVKFGHLPKRRRAEFIQNDISPQQDIPTPTRSSTAAAPAAASSTGPSSRTESSWAASATQRRRPTCTSSSPSTATSVPPRSSPTAAARPRATGLSPLRRRRRPRSYRTR